MLTYFLFIVGFIFLIKGADLLVEGASSLAKKFGVSSLAIGLTVVAFGTTMPELIVNLFASFNNANDLAVGNILGSNITNILLILGIAALISPIIIREGTVKREIPFSFLVILILGILVNDSISGFSTLTLSRSDGLILLLFLSIFIYYSFIIYKIKGEHPEHIPEYRLWPSLERVLGGAAALLIGAHWIVEGAIKLAAFFNLSQALIGLTVIAIGTSLPELATSITAARKNKCELAVGNLIGANILNISWILGISSVIQPLNFSANLNFDILMVMLATVVAFLFMFVGKKNILERWQGGVMVGLYVLYIGYLIVRG